MLVPATAFARLRVDVGAPVVEEYNSSVSALRSKPVV